MNWFLCNNFFSSLCHIFFGHDSESHETNAHPNIWINKQVFNSPIRFIYFTFMKIPFILASEEWQPSLVFLHSITRSERCKCVASSNRFCGESIDKQSECVWQRVIHFVYECHDSFSWMDWSHFVIQSYPKFIASPSFIWVIILFAFVERCVVSIPFSLFYIFSEQRPDTFIILYLINVFVFVFHFCKKLVHWVKWCW